MIWWQVVLVIALFAGLAVFCIHQCCEALRAFGRIADERKWVLDIESFGFDPALPGSDIAVLVVRSPDGEIAFLDVPPPGDFEKQIEATARQSNDILFDIPWIRSREGKYAYRPAYPLPGVTYRSSEEEEPA